MMLKQVSNNGSYPMGNLFYYYLKNGKEIKNLSPLLHKQKNLIIELTTVVQENVLESLILPKKFSENGL